MSTSKSQVNELLKFREEHKLQDECILDVIQDYCHKYDMSLDEFIDNLEDYELFRDFVEEDLIKHKYLRAEMQNNVSMLDEFLRM